MSLNDLGFKIKKLKDFSILHKLRNRETFTTRPNTHHHHARDFYCNVLPNYSLIDVEKPPCFLRKFSPDGQYFIAFSSDQSSLEIYQFQGVFGCSVMCIFTFTASWFNMTSWYLPPIIMFGFSRASRCKWPVRWIGRGHFTRKVWGGWLYSSECLQQILQVKALWLVFQCFG